MKVKIDTKEKFHTIMPLEEIIPANMTGELNELLLPFLNKEVKNVVLNMREVKSLEKTSAEAIATIQQTFYENNCSFVICELQKEVEKFLDQAELLEMLNVTPTESEAWDILQMEEIEREYE